jgi:hypothetical protein
LENEAARVAMDAGWQVAMWGGESRDRRRPDKPYFEKILGAKCTSRVQTFKVRKTLSTTS